MDKSTTTPREDRLLEENAKLKAANEWLKDAYEQAMAENKDLRKAHLMG